MNHNNSTEQTIVQYLNSALHLTECSAERKLSLQIWQSLKLNYLQRQI